VKALALGTSTAFAERTLAEVCQLQDCALVAKTVLVGVDLLVTFVLEPLLPLLF